MRQQQFLQVVSRDEAERRFREAVSFLPLEVERVPIGEARGRVLAEEICAPRDVPGFSRANVDGYAVRSADIYGAAEETPARLRLTGEVLATGVAPRIEVAKGLATPIATGAVLPRGADAAVMLEDTDPEGDESVIVRRPVVPGANVSHAGSDIARGETILRRGDELGSRETGLLAALGLATAPVIRRPRVAVFSTGDEIFLPGEELPVGGLHDSNGRILADAVEESGGLALERGILRDDEPVLRAGLEQALADCDLVLFSGGTSKGAGDLSYRVVAERGRMVVHGVALKPGKPVVLAVVDSTPVVILPGFPTSAVFTFHEFVAPWIRARSGRPPASRRSVTATLPRALVSERGRKEYDLVRLVSGREGLVAHPVGKGSGSLTTFALADGFIAVPEATERLEKDEPVEVTLLGPLEAPDLVVIGSHCTGLDLLLTMLRRRGFTSRVIAAGSTAGLEAVRRGECDLAGVHLLDEETGDYNTPFLSAGVRLERGYGRKQGVVSRDGDESGRLVNRNRGSGTRILIDRLLAGRRPDGYDFEVRSHRAVAAAVAAGSADWGVCIENVAQGLHFRFFAEERFDFLIPEDRADRPPVRAFVDLLGDAESRRRLAEDGFCP